MECNSRFSSSHIKKKKSKETGEVSLIIYLTHYNENIISNIINIKIIKTVYVFFVLSL